MKYSNDDEHKYYPCFKWNKSSGFTFTGSLFNGSYSYIGIFLSTNDGEKSDYIGKQFIDIFNDLLQK